MNHKVIIETERQLRDVYTATFSQAVLEQLAAQFIAEQQGIDLGSHGVRTQFETNINPEAGQKRRVNMRVCVCVDAPIEDESEAVGEAQAPSAQGFYACTLKRRIAGDLEAGGEGLRANRGQETAAPPAFLLKTSRKKVKKWLHEAESLLPQLQ